MNRLELSLNAPGAMYLPGEELRGELVWELQSEPARLELALFWTTEGKGSTDSGTVDTVVLEHPGASGRQDFRFQLPEAPHSFTGKLISLVWGVEAVSKRPKAQTSVPFVMSPAGEPIVLGAPEEEDPRPAPVLKLFKR